MSCVMTVVTVRNMCASCFGWAQRRNGRKAGQNLGELVRGSCTNSVLHAHRIRKLHYHNFCRILCTSDRACNDDNAEVLIVQYATLEQLTADADCAWVVGKICGYMYILLETNLPDAILLQALQSLFCVGGHKMRFMPAHLRKQAILITYVHIPSRKTLFKAFRIGFHSGLCDLWNSRGYTKAEKLPWTSRCVLLWLEITSAWACWQLAAPTLSRTQLPVLPVEVQLSPLPLDSKSIIVTWYVRQPEFKPFMKLSSMYVLYMIRVYSIKLLIAAMFHSSEKSELLYRWRVNQSANCFAEGTNISRSKSVRRRQQRARVSLTIWRQVRFGRKSLLCRSPGERRREYESMHACSTLIRDRHPIIQFPAEATFRNTPAGKKKVFFQWGFHPATWEERPYWFRLLPFQLLIRHVFQ